MPGDIIILKCTKNHDHMLYCSRDMVLDGINYFSFWAICCPFNPIADQKIKIWKKWKKCLETSPFYTCVTKIMIKWCTVPGIWCMRGGQMDEHTDWKSDIEKRALHLKMSGSFGVFLFFFPNIAWVSPIKLNHRPWHDAQAIALTCTVTCANQEKGGLGGQWNAHLKVKLRGLISPMPNSK